MLTIARTLRTGPRVLRLDEPSEGPAPVVVAALAENVAARKRQGLTILMAEQNVKFARRLADRAYIIEKGQIRFEGTMATLDADESLRRAYLSVWMGGPEMAPHTPQRSSRRGAAVARLAPQRSSRPGAAVARLG